MRVLVTGYNGYVGTVMTPLLVKAGHEVVGVDTNLYHGSTFGTEPNKQGITEIKKIFATWKRATWQASTRSCTWRRSPTTRWAISTPN